VTHSLEFDLDCDANTSELRIGLGGAPGMFEINEISLVYEGSQSEVRAYCYPELANMLRALINSAGINTGLAYWLFVAPHPAVLSFRYWKDGEERLPQKLRLKCTYQNRLLDGKFLHLRVLSAVTREQFENEALRRKVAASEKRNESLLERATYGIGSKIDFSNTGNGVFFMRTGWSYSEPWGTWTQGSEALLRIRLAEIPRRNLQMNVCVRAFVPRGYPERHVNVRLNGKLLAAWKLTNFDFVTLGSEISIESVQDGICEIVFEILNPISPRLAGASGDGRLLGLGFKSMDLQE
jgi:hypothetical protein